MRPTRTGSPVRVHSLDATRRLPQTATIRTRTKTPDAIARAVDGVAAPRTRPAKEVEPTAISASAAPTAATSIDTPYTPKMLASCAIGSTVAWLYPSSTHGNPVNRYVRPNSAVTHTSGAAISATGPFVTTKRRTITAKNAGNSARYAMRAAFTSTATHPWRPPYTAITRVIQYSVPVKDTTPVASPSANVRRNGDLT